MKFIEHRDSPTARAAIADDTFEQLQLAFYERLRKDRAGLAVLGTALAHAVANPAPALQALRTFAHRLRGAAAIFGATEICDAAESLEVAALAAPQPQDDPDHGVVWSALALLTEVLVSVTDSATRYEVSAAASYGSKHA
jgi:HPt (histidine-containing phosphotransfer) domain-containing protein